MQNLICTFTPNGEKETHNITFSLPYTGKHEFRGHFQDVGTSVKYLIEVIKTSQGIFKWNNKDVLAGYKLMEQFSEHIRICTEVEDRKNNDRFVQNLEIARYSLENFMEKYSDTNKIATYILDPHPIASGEFKEIENMKFESVDQMVTDANRYFKELTNKTEFINKCMPRIDKFEKECYQFFHFTYVYVKSVGNDAEFINECRLKMAGPIPWVEIQYETAKATNLMREILKTRLIFLSYYWPTLKYINLHTDADVRRKILYDMDEEGKSPNIE